LLAGLFRCVGVSDSTKLNFRDRCLAFRVGDYARDGDQRRSQWPFPRRSTSGERVSLTIDDPNMPLLYALRDNLGLHGPRFGCGLGQCGACTVHIDGTATRSCIMPLSGLTADNAVVTLEGLGSIEKPHPVQQAFIDEQAAQCGYCINGMIMESAAFLAKTKAPTEAAIKEALANNLCRCGTHLRIVKAVRRAAMKM
jgi:nicotinate dehydrogenase subunit A